MGKALLRSLYDTDAVLLSWPTLVPGLEKILDSSGEDTNLTKILNDLLSGKLLLWMGFIDEEPIGFVTTSFQQIPMGPKYLWIVHAFKKVRVPSQYLLDCFGSLEEFAKEQKCKFIKFYGLRRSWQEKMLAAGFEEGYVEYILDLEKNKETQNADS